MPAAEEVVTTTARDAGLPKKYGDYVQLTKISAQSLLSRMGCTPLACKKDASHFEDVRDVFMALHLKLRLTMSQA